ncbi:Conidiophore development regulator abaB [Paramyrothecium foliicola]|nr:Conidiophore development regulator abaB [Paramyrothecium foliicola]
MDTETAVVGTHANEAPPHWIPPNQISYSWEGYYASASEDNPISQSRQVSKPKTLNPGDWSPRNNPPTGQRMLYVNPGTAPAITDASARSDQRKNFAVGYFIFGFSFAATTNSAPMPVEYQRDLFWVAPELGRAASALPQHVQHSQIPEPVNPDVPANTNLTTKYSPADLIDTDHKPQHPAWSINASETISSVLKRLGEAEVQDAQARIVVDDEKPYTDSGYASCAPRGVQDLITSPTNIREENGEEDMRTVYSAETSANPTNTQNYILDLAQHIQWSLQEYVDPVARLELCKFLPNLIKNFAIRITCENPSRLHREVMYFIHKRHRDIAVEVEKLLLQADDDAPELAIRATPGGMSLDEKMHLWVKTGRLSKSHGE